MPTKKATRPRSTRASQPATIPTKLRRRAEAIINHTQKYDGETRAAISQLLTEGDDETLAKMVARVESGETILDLTQHDRAEQVAQPDTAEQGERRAFLIGRVLRDADADAFKAFTELLDAEAKPEVADELLELCEVVGSVKDAARVKDSRNSADRKECADDVFKTMTYREARVIAARLRGLDMSDERRGDLLALMYGLTYAENPVERELALYEVVEVFLPRISSALEAVEQLAIERLRASEPEASKIG
jgi:hypothetical protein